ncbi:MAG TPA: FAD-dependent oxidoreductase [Stellaceae bacterium]|nr:FAD-dependent oxidoreductase [Stellaceae bacterium]
MTVIAETVPLDLVGSEPATVPEPLALAEVSGSNGVAVIGAGIAGLACARRLAGAGIPVRLFDKGREVGGRVATHWAEPHHFDHGAQYFTARDERFQPLVEGWIAAGIVASWTGPIVVLGSTPNAAGASSHAAGGDTRYVGVPGMSAIGRALAVGLTVETGIRVTGLACDEDRWRLVGVEGAATEPRDLGVFGRVVVAIPSPLAADLLRSVAPDLAARAAVARMEACWAVMAVYDQPLALDFAGAFVERSPLAWVARDATKPRRAATETVILHGAGDWSEAHLEDPPERVVEALLDAFAAAIGRPLPRPTSVMAHRWRYSRSLAPLGVAAMVDPHLGLALCGDWVLGGRVEEAYLSGLAAADQLIVGSGDGVAP